MSEHLGTICTGDALTWSHHAEQHMHSRVWWFMRKICTDTIVCERTNSVVRWVMRMCVCVRCVSRGHRFFITYKAHPHLNGKYTGAPHTHTHTHTHTHCQHVAKPLPPIHKSCCPCSSALLRLVCDQMCVSVCVRVVFGHVIDGLDTLDRMEKVPVGPGDKPKTDMVLERVTIHANPVAL